MSEILSNNSEYETPILLDRSLVIGRLQEYGVPIEPEDLEGLDEDEVYDAILTYALQAGVDMDEILPQVAPVESRDRSGDGP
jgi:hypothetical protein|tara:strand:- start:833 stop:1078 length:246 start_codon:yes stop_codon:yes gene_type:complete